MTKIKQAQQILKALGLDKAQQNDISALTFLALCNIKEKDKWVNASKHSLKVTKGIMTFVNEEYNVEYAPNTRETFRRQVLHQFIQAGIVDYNPDNPKLPVNSPNAHYAISNSALIVIRTFGTKEFSQAVSSFNIIREKTIKNYNKQRAKNLIPVDISKKLQLKLSSGKHNEVQAAVVMQFMPHFAKDGIVLYLGDTAKKDLYLETDMLSKLGIPIDRHSKLPDIMIYDKSRNWLYLIEVVTSHGPMTPKRIIELEEFLKDCKAGKIYITAFPDIAEFKRHMFEIAWETEVWLADTPQHMIHYNGDKFIGPR